MTSKNSIFGEYMDEKSLSEEDDTHQAHHVDIDQKQWSTKIHSSLSGGNEEKLKVFRCWIYMMISFTILGDLYGVAQFKYLQPIGLYIMLCKTLMLLSMIVMMCCTCTGKRLSLVPISMVCLQISILVPNVFSKFFHRPDLPTTALSEVSETRVRLIFSSNFFLISLFFNTYFTFCSIQRRSIKLVIGTITYAAAIVKIVLDQSELFFDLTPTEIKKCIQNMFVISIIMLTFVITAYRLNRLEIKQATKSKRIS